MKLILDTANLEDIRYFNTYYPIVGVTTNPTILAKEGGDVLALLREIRSIIGEEKELHVQVTETTYEKMVEEAEAIVAFLGKNTYVKIPATDVGLRATATLAKKGIGITVTSSAPFLARSTQQRYSSSRSSFPLHGSSKTG